MDNSIQASSDIQVPTALQPLVPYITWLVGRMAEGLAPAPYYYLQCVSVEVAAGLLGVKPDTVRTKIKCGTLAATKEGKSYIIRCADLQQYLTSHSNQAKPKYVGRRHLVIPPRTVKLKKA